MHRLCAGVRPAAVGCRLRRARCHLGEPTIESRCGGGPTGNIAAFPAGVVLEPEQNESSLPLLLSVALIVVMLIDLV